MKNLRKVHLLSFLVIFSKLFGIVGANPGKVLAAAINDLRLPRSAMDELTDTITYLGSLGTTVTETISANFAANTNTSHSLTLNPISGGTLTAPSNSPGKNTPATAVTSAASANPGHHFANWPSLTNTVNDSKSALTIVVMNGNYVVQANFASDSGVTFTLTTGVSPVEDDHTYSEGTDVSVSASPANGQVFEHWSGAWTDSGICSVTMDADWTITANFEIMTSFLGEVNRDSLLKSTDALIILARNVDIPIGRCCSVWCGDVNDDSLVNTTDALIILSFNVGMSVPFPMGLPDCPAFVTLCPGCLS